MTRHEVRRWLLAAILGVGSGCATAIAQSRKPLSTSPPVLQVKMNGGLTPTGVLNSSLLVRSDRSVMVNGKPPAPLPAADQRLLVTQIRQANFDAICSRKGNGDQPSSSDGLDIVLHVPPASRRGSHQQLGHADRT